MTVKGLKKLLRDSRASISDLDGTDRVSAHRAVLEGKPMLQEVFREIHTIFLDLDRRLLSAPGARIELGAGVFPVQQSDPSVIATDVVFAPRLDVVVDACAMPFQDGSVRAIYCQNAFHHFPFPRQFFSELVRVLAPGGGAIILEPYHGALASWIYPALFASEGFDKLQPNWETPASGPMNGANQALSYVIFERDRKRFEAEFPSLRIVHKSAVGNYLRYLLSGGLNFRQLVPDWMVPLLRWSELLLNPLARVLALHHVTVIARTS